MKTLLISLTFALTASISSTVLAGEYDRAWDDRASIEATTEAASEAAIIAGQYDWTWS